MIKQTFLLLGLLFLALQTHAQDEFITTWQIDNDGDDIRIPTTGSGYDYTIDWGDGTIETNRTGSTTHAYTTAGTYTVKISGDFPRIYFNNGGDKDQILTIEQWGNIEWSSMKNAFYGCTNLEINATDAPDLSNCTSLSSMFEDCSSLNSDLNQWDVSTITDMSSVFENASSFNGDISSWNTSKVEYMESMFRNASVFNQDIGDWNIKSLSRLDYVFENAISFNQDLSRWSTGSISDMTSLFEGASSFNQNLADWDMRDAEDMANMLSGTAMSTQNYDSTLIGWEAQNLNLEAFSFGASGLTYCQAADARQALRNDHNWRFSGDSYDCSAYAFITTWQIDNDGDDITIPTTGSGYDYEIDWGDGTVETNQTGSATHTYATAGTYTVEILGDFPRIFFDNDGDKDQILTVEQWGDIEWTSMDKAFYGCSNLEVNATDGPDLSNCTDLGQMFANASTLSTPDFTNWDVSTITEMNSLFNGATNFNGDISTWNVENVTIMSSMFLSCKNFAGDLSSWNPKSLEFMTWMFASCKKFNSDISSWDVSNVSGFSAVFSDAEIFDQDISSWDVSNGVAFTRMLDNCGMSTENYDKLLIGWSQLTLGSNKSIGVDGMTYCSGLTARQKMIDDFDWSFSVDSEDCSAYESFNTTWQIHNDGDDITIPTTGSGYDYTIDWGDGTIETNRTGSTTHAYTTAGTYTVKISGDFPRIYFNNGGDKTQILTIEQWGNIEWTNMSDAFEGCSNLEINATDAPDLSNCTSLSSMFEDCSSLNSDLNQWDVSTITEMSSMFENASSFNGDISSWNTSKVQYMEAMFEDASSFNSDISGWDVRNVYDMEAMFRNASVFNQDIGDWNIRSLYKLDYVFENAISFNQDLSRWSTGSISDMTSLFEGASAFNQNLADWDMRDAEDLGNILSGTAMSTQNYDSTLIGWEAQNLNLEVYSFGASGLTYCQASDARQALIDDHNWIFRGDSYDCAAYETFITTWQIDSDGDDITIPTNSSYTYDYEIDWGDGTVETNLTGDATHTYATAGTYSVEISGTFPAIYFNNGGDKTQIQTIEQWGEIEWTSMERAFYGCSSLEINATDAPDLSAVTSMTGMFRDATSFDGDLSHWDVSTVEAMDFLFRNASSFNGSINSWDVSKVTTFKATFKGASAFNQPLDNWNVSNVTNLLEAFRDAATFNQDISSWDVSNVKNFNSTFNNASAFNQNLGAWDVSSGTGFSDMLDLSGLSTSNYDSILVGWSNLILDDGKSFGVEGLTYCSGSTARQKIIDDFGWSFTGDSEDCSDVFITTWQIDTDGDDITIPFTGTDFQVDWGDGTLESGLSGSVSHTYSTAGVYTVTASGDVSQIRFNNSSSKDAILSVEQWGDIVWTSMEDAFYGCANLAINATDAPDLSSCSSMNSTFRSCTAFNQDISHWDVSTIDDMAALFNNATSFNQPLDAWDVSNVTDMGFMFNNATSFNQPIGSWNVGLVTDMEQMFSDATNFNQAIGSWNVSNVTQMVEMFYQAEAFNQDIGSWDVSNIKSMNLLFGQATAFNQDISAWDVSSVTDMTETFYNASSFNQDIRNWNVSKVRTMEWMFGGATSFDQNLGDWDMSRVSEASDMFWNAGLSVNNYDSTLMGWSTQTLKDDVELGAFGLVYCVGETARQLIIDTYNWEFDRDASCSETAFITTWEITNDGDDITIPTTGSGYDYIINWGDGNFEINQTGSVTHAYTTAGTYTVEIYGDFPQIYFNNGGDKDNILTIEQWGETEWTSMEDAFYGCTNLDVNATDAPDLSNVTSLHGMFRQASSFNHNLGDWDISNVVTLSNMLDSTALSRDNYDSTLIGWSALTLQEDVAFGAVNLTYCNASAERQSIIDNFNWTITDAGAGCPFITTWQTNSIIIPTNPSYTYDYSVDWGDGTVETGFTGDASHSYASTGSYTVEISGTFPAILFSNLSWSNRSKIRTIEQWGDIAWEDMTEAFYGCTRLSYNATDAPDLTNVTSLQSTFNRAYDFNGDLSNWDVSTITDMTYTFYNAYDFNQNINNWDTRNVTSIAYMFYAAYNFNQDLSNWNTSNITNMRGVFEEGYSFNQNLSTWDVSKVTNMANMFDSTRLSTENYDQMLIAWSQQSLQNNVTLGAPRMLYCLSEAERQKIIDDFGWNIIDDGIDADCATNTTWDGSTWDNGAPTTGVYAILDADYDTYVDGELVSDGLAVKSGHSLTVRGDSAVTMDGDLTNLGSIFVQDTTSFIQTATSPTNTGDGFYSLEREGTDYRGAYNYWSSPVRNTTIEEVIGTTGRHFYTFDAVNQAWEGASTTEVLEAGLGFIATGTSLTTTSIVRTFSDSSGFNSGDVTQSLYYSGGFDANDNWHLVGNPYPSGLDAISFLTDNAANIESAVYLWSSDGSDYHSSSSDYTVMNLAGSVSAGGSGIAPTSTTISSAQGFFIQSKASGSVLFSNSQRVSTNNTFQRTHTAHMQRIWVGVEKDNGAKNEILLAFLDGAETEQDSYDANKLSGNSSVSLYTVGAFKSGTRPLAIQGLPALTEATVVPMGIEAKEAGEFTFRLNHLDRFDGETEIYLADKETGSLVNIRTETYSVNLATGDYQDRFELRFVPAQVTSLEEEKALEVGVRLFATEGEVRVQFLKSEFAEATVGVYEISGRLIGSYQNESDLEVGFSVPQTGVYIVKVVNRYGTVSKKLFVD